MSQLGIWINKVHNFKYVFGFLIRVNQVLGLTSVLFMPQIGFIIHVHHVLRLTKYTIVRVFSYSANWVFNTNQPNIWVNKVLLVYFSCPTNWVHNSSHPDIWFKKIYNCKCVFLFCQQVYNTSQLGLYMLPSRFNFVNVSVFFVFC